MGYQHTVIVGNVGREPEMSYTPQGIAVCKFSVAVSKVTGKGENRKEKTTWFRCTVWRERAETASQFVKKGMKILVSGEVDVTSYTNKQGQPAATIELTVNDFQFLDSRTEGEPAAATTGDSAEESQSLPF